MAVHGWLSSALQPLGLSLSISWLGTVGSAVAWLVWMLAYSPIADRLATRLIAKPPTLGAFRALQESTLKLVIGIIVAWILGGFLEEVFLRGVVLQAVERAASTVVPASVAAGLGVVTAAGIAGLLHLYQGRRAAIVITQLSVLFGILFVVSGHNLWSVILCHGLYDTVAFIRFATKTSKYSKLDASPQI